MRQAFLAKTGFRKYLLYALGEILLIIIGILIALQIYSWNSERKQQQTLTNHLNSIAIDIRDDLEEAAAVRARRDEAYELSMRQFFFVSEESSFEVADIVLTNNALTQANAIHFFNSNSSSFDALKASGNLDLLQGGDIERLLYDYYDTVNRIVRAEQSHNAYVRLLSLEVIDEWPTDMQDSEFSLPDALTEDRFQTLQPLYRQVIGSAATNALLGHARAVGPLMLEYERLDRLGNVFVSMVENQTMEFDDKTKVQAYDTHDPTSGLGNPDLIADGNVTWHSYELGIVHSANVQAGGRAPDANEAGNRQLVHLRSIDQPDARFYIDYRGGADWAVVFFTVRGSAEARASKDFTSYDTLRLELKGEIGGEKLLVHMKDSTDPDDGSQANIEIQVTDQWQTYDIDLARFGNADLSHLHVALGFLFDTEAVAFSVRNVEFVTAD